MSREGTRAGRWIARYPLGEGGGGSVWFAEPVDAGAEGVAVKFYPALRTSREEFRREAAVALRNRHPNLLRMVDAGVLDDDTPWLALEHVAGEDLRTRLERGLPGGAAEGPRVGPGDAVQVGVQVFAALDAMHRAGLAHGDVKPENVLLQGDVVRLVDFGRARLHHLYGDAAVFPGTQPYMHPALFKGGAPTPLTDCFAAWVTLYECIAGHRPFHPRQLSAPGAGEGAALPPWRGLVDPTLDRLVEGGLRGALPDARSGWVALERYLRGREDLPAPLPPPPDPPAAVVQRALAIARSGAGVALTSEGQAASRALALVHRGWALRGGTVLWARASWGSPDTPMSGALGFASHAADGLADEDLERIAAELGPRAAVIVAASPSTRAWLPPAAPSPPPAGRARPGGGRGRARPRAARVLRRVPEAAPAARRGARPRRRHQPPVPRGARHPGGRGRRVVGARRAARAQPRAGGRRLGAAGGGPGRPRAPGRVAGAARVGARAAVR